MPSHHSSAGAQETGRVPQGAPVYPGLWGLGLKADGGPGIGYSGEEVTTCRSEGREHTVAVAVGQPAAAGGREGARSKRLVRKARRGGQV